MNDVILKATHGDPSRPLRIGNAELSCYVLEDERRVVSKRGLQNGLGMSIRGSEERFTKFLRVFDARGIDCKELIARIDCPIKFKSPTGIASGYEATTLVALCKAIRDARRQGILKKQQWHIADRCEQLLDAFAELGIVALIDEATGFQKDRPDDALEKLMSLLLQNTPREWRKTFQDKYYSELARIYEWDFYQRSKNPPQCAAGLTKLLVYDRLAPGLAARLEVLNPMTPSGRRRARHHQFLTNEVGAPELQRYLDTLLTILSLAQTPAQLWNFMDIRLPKYADRFQRHLFQ